MFEPKFIAYFTNSPSIGTWHFTNLEDAKKFAETAGFAVTIEPYVKK